MNVNMDETYNKNGRHICSFNAKEKAEIAGCLNEYMFRLNQRDKMWSEMKYCEVPEFMKEKQPRYEENRLITPLITSVPVMEFRLTYDRNKVKENQDNPNMTYILLEEPEEETISKVTSAPFICCCCNMTCFSPCPPQYLPCPTANKLCYPCYNYCYPQNQYVNVPQQWTCQYKQYSQCQPVKLQSSPQYCVPSGFRQPCFRWGDECGIGIQPPQQVQGIPCSLDCSSNVPPCRERTECGNRVWEDLQPSDCQNKRDCYKKDSAPKRRNCMDTRRLLDCCGGQEITVVEDDQYVHLQESPESTLTDQFIEPYVYTSLVSTEQPVNLWDIQQTPRNQTPQLAQTADSPVQPDEDKLQKNKPYKRYKLKAPYMYDIPDSDSE